MGRISRLRLKRRSDNKQRDEGISREELAVLSGAPLPDAAPPPAKKKDGIPKVPEGR
jgi:hypothetical protein